MNPAKVFFTSDTHFGHAGVLNYCQRPFANTEEMDKEMVHRWNSVVPFDGHVFHLGDVSFLKPDKTAELLATLNGHIYLVQGNHDTKLVNKYAAHFDWVKDYFELKFDGERVVLCHYPLQSWNRGHHGSWHLHGHSHGNLPNFGRRVDIGVDAAKFLSPMHYAPVPYIEIKKYMHAQYPVSKDQHKVREEDGNQSEE
jgi:calcineurin-like phosphoesterase family protein